MGSNRKIYGFRRSKDVFGIRNHVVVMPTVNCANPVVRKIADNTVGITPIFHQHGCDLIGDDCEQVMRTLVGIGNNPNVGGILVVSLGCESIGLDEVLDGLHKSDKPVEKLVIQEIGDMDEIVRQGKECLSGMKSTIETQVREEFDISRLVVGVECGASDSFSGITANPAVGLAADRLVMLGATVILSETPELIGTEHLLMERIADKEHQSRLLSKTRYYLDTAGSMGWDLLGANPTPGNINSGISSIEEKALGAVSKGGSSRINEVVDYAETPHQKGLVIMDTPGNDPESVTGMAAGGAHVILFTTGLGTPLGFPVTPVIKISSNSETFNHLRSFIDLDAGGILKGQMISEVADSIFELILEVSSGKVTASEKWDNGEIAINRIAPTF